MVVLAGQPCFFIEIAVGFTISGAVDLAIGEAVSMERDVAVGFSGLFLW